MRLLSLFHFFLIKPNYGILSQPPDIHFKYYSPINSYNLVKLFKNNNHLGIHEYNTKHGFFLTTIIKNKSEYSSIEWNNTSIIDMFIDTDVYIKLDIYGNILMLNNNKINKNIPLENNDYLTCADYSNNKGIAVSFYNYIYLFDNNMLFKIDYLNNNSFLLAKKVKIYCKNGPINVLIQYQIGGLLFIKYFNAYNIIECKIIEQSMITLNNIIDFDFDYKHIYILNEDKHLIIYSLKKHTILKQYKYKKQLTNIYLNDTNIYFFESKKMIWYPFSLEMLE